MHVVYRASILSTANLILKHTTSILYSMRHMMSDKKSEHSEYA